MDVIKSMDAINQWMQQINGCNKSMDVINQWMQWMQQINGCNKSMDVINKWVQQINGCNGCNKSMDVIKSMDAIKSMDVIKSMDGENQVDALHPTIDILPVNLQDQTDYGIARLELHIEKIQTQIRKQQSQMRLMQKQLDLRVKSVDLTETLALVSGGIHLDPTILKLLKLRQMDESKSSNVEYGLSRKLQQISECIKVVMEAVRKVDRRTNSIQLQFNASLQERIESIQQQLDEYKGQSIKELLLMSEKMDGANNQAAQKLRDMESKTDWKLQDLKIKMEEKMSVDSVRTMLDTTQKQIESTMKQYQLSCSIDPARIDIIENQIEHNRITLSNAITQCQYNTTALSQHIDKHLLLLSQYHSDRVAIQHRLKLFNSNLEDTIHRATSLQLRESASQISIKSLLQQTKTNTAEVSRINTVLVNLRIGEDFQRMLQEMDPSKILELQHTVDSLQQDHLSIHKQFDLTKRELERLNSSLSVQDILLPNTKTKTISKEAIQTALDIYLQDHNFTNKLHQLQKEIRQCSISVDAVGELKRVMTRLLKETDWTIKASNIQDIIHQLKMDINAMKKKDEEGNNRRKIEIEPKQEKIKNIRSKKILAISSISSISRGISK